MISVGSGDSVTTVSTDQNAVDAMIKAGGTLTDAQAASSITIKVNSKLLDGKDTENARMSLQGELVHEGKHVDDGKNFLQDYSNGTKSWAQVRDFNNYDREDRAYREEAAYFLHRGGAYIGVGVERSALNAQTKLYNAVAINRAINLRNSEDELNRKYSSPPSRLSKEYRPKILADMKRTKNK